MLVYLDDNELEALRRPTNGRGGFQSLLRSLASDCKGNVLNLSEGLAERIRRYSERYGPGGFQSRLQAILRKIPH